jgi:hypothetical protein
MTPHKGHEQEVAAIIAKLTKAQRAMISRARPGWNEPPRMYGPGITKKALRDRGLAHGDFAYLTPLGLAVRTALASQEQEK